jgi:hypothetical protein
VTPIRPSAFPVQPPANAVSGVGADAARAAAQKAFFDAAMGRSAAPAAPAAPLAAAAPRASVFAPAAPIQRAEIRPDPSAEAPTRILRPGSLLDIRV